jgi:sarcosine oxidase subunit beta
MKEKRNVDICIIGGGIYGLVTAYQLARRGREVLVVDRGPYGMEASRSNAGSIAIQNKALKMLAETVKAAHRWENLSEELGVDVGYKRLGGFRLASSEADIELLKSRIPVQRKAGVPVELIEGQALRKEAPYLSTEVLAAGYCHMDGKADPFKAVFAYANAFERLNGIILTHAPVKRISSAGKQVVVETPSGSIFANKIVNTAGAWAGLVSAMVGVPLPVTEAVNMGSITEPGPEFIPHIVTHCHGNLTVKQTDGRIIIGGAWRGDGDPFTGRQQVNLTNIRGNLAWAYTMIPAIRGFRVLRSWSGFQGQSPDRLFMMGELPPYDGRFYIMAAGSGGFGLAPIIGEQMAEWIHEGAVTKTITDNFKLFDVRRYCPDQSEKVANVI